MTPVGARGPYRAVSDNELAEVIKAPYRGTVYPDGFDDDSPTGVLPGDHEPDIGGLTGSSAGLVNDVATCNLEWRPG